MGGGAWPFLVGGVICLVNSVNERDLSLLYSVANGFSFVFLLHFKEGHFGLTGRKFEATTGLLCP